MGCISPPPPSNPLLILTSSSSSSSSCKALTVLLCYGYGALRSPPSSPNSLPPWSKTRTRSSSARSAPPCLPPALLADSRLLGNASSSKLIPSALRSPLSAAVTERTVALPIDYYQVLGVDAHVLADAVIRAYEYRAKNPPEEGFSKDALRARQEILAAACETLADPDLRAEYNHSLTHDEVETIMVDVPFSKVPGVLCLLQEVGEMEIALQVGETLLKERLTKVYRRDVILSMALACVEISRESMAETPPAVMRSFEMLEKSLKLLQEEGGNSLAPALQEQIGKTLEHLNPRYMLELLALPLDKEHEGDRQLGLQGIRGTLWSVAEGGACAPIPGFTREQFIKAAFLQMKSSEIVDLFVATPSNIPAESSEVYAVALAHVAQGFSRKEPHLIKEADTLILELQQANTDLGVADRKLEFAFERGMCGLLLGEIDDCCAWLGLADPNSLYRDEYVSSFVVANSSMTVDGDFLPGLCKLLEYWLAEVIFPSFRDLKDMKPFKLTDYFDDPTVLSYLKSLEKGKSPLAAAAAIVKLGVGAGAALDNVKASALETLQKVFPIPRKSNVTEIPSKNHTDDIGYSSHLQQDAGLVSENRKLQSLDNSSRKSSRYCPGEVVTSKSNQMIKIREFFFYSRWETGIKIVGTTLLIGLFTTAAWKSLISPGFGALQQRANLGAARIADHSPGFLTSFFRKSRPGIDANVAKEVVQNWQVAKAKALGHKHDIEQLSEVLDGQMLRSWTERAQEVHQNGWYWEYELTDLIIESVDVSKDGNRATVEAMLWEGASLYDEKSKDDATDSYHSSYTTRYDLVLDGEGRWKIISGSVVRC